MQPNLFDTFTPASGAVITPCQTYRYRLWRRWADGPQVCWIMLNPSTADHQIDDPTIRRCLGFTRAFGYGGLTVVNLFAYRATEVRDMKAAVDPIGPENDRHLVDAAREAGLVLAAWGNDGVHRGRSQAVRRLLAEAGVDLHALKVGKTGEPGHPLYLSGLLRPMLLDGAAAAGAVGGEER